MASILDILIEILKIDCGIAQCYYANEIEAMFYLLFFPTIFIILFIYILTNFIFRGGGMVRGIRLLIAVGAYAFIVFEGWFTLVVSVSHLWWILTIILVGLFAFVRYLFTGGRKEERRGGLAGVMEETRRNIGQMFIKKKIEEPLIEALGLNSDERQEYEKILNKYRKYGGDLSKLEPGEQAIMELAMAMAGSGGSPKQIRDLKSLLKSESKD
jgi:hypothetical protein